jgi:hypothetical protein
MTNKTTVSASSSGYPSLLFIVFLVLKLTGTVDWSWWWVTAPLWLPASLIGLVLLVLLAVDE